MLSVMFSYMVDPEVRCEVLAIPGIPKKLINDVITLVESKEMACNSVESSTLSSVSSFKQQKTMPSNMSTIPTRAEQAKQGPCSECNTTFKGRGLRLEHQTSPGLYKLLQNPPQRKRQQRSSQAPSSNVQAIEPDQISQVASLLTGKPGSPPTCCHHRCRGTCPHIAQLTNPQ